MGQRIKVGFWRLDITWDITKDFPEPVGVGVGVGGWGGGGKSESQR